MCKVEEWLKRHHRIIRKHARLHGITFRKLIFLIVTALGTSCHITWNLVEKFICKPPVSDFNHMLSLLPELQRMWTDTASRLWINFSWIIIQNKLEVWTIHIKNPTRCNSVSKFYFVFIWSSTCFGRHTAHHQEPKTLLTASGFAYVECCWTCGYWTLTASSNYTANNPPRVQSKRLLVQF